jgi:hypothetical protein
MNILLVRGKPTFMDMIVGIPIGLVYRSHRPEVRPLRRDSRSGIGDRS